MTDAKDRLGEREIQKLTPQASEARELKHRSDGEKDETECDFTEHLQRSEIFSGDPTQDRRSEGDAGEDVPGHFWNTNHLDEVAGQQRQ